MARFIRTALAVIGALTLVALICALIGWYVFIRPFKNFAGGHCTDSEQVVLHSPDGKRDIKSFRRVCGTEKTYTFYFVYLSTGNPNKGYEYTPIAEFRDVEPGQVSVAWDSPNQVSIHYPSSAKVEDTYAQVLGVRVVLNPPLPVAR